MACSECKGREWFNRIIDTPPVRGYYDFVLERVPCDCTSGAHARDTGAHTSAVTERTCPDCVSGVLVPFIVTGGPTLKWFCTEAHSGGGTVLAVYHCSRKPRCTVGMCVECYEKGTPQ